MGPLGVWTISGILFCGASCSWMSRGMAPFAFQGGLKAKDPRHPEPGVASPGAWCQALPASRRATPRSMLAEKSWRRRVLDLRASGRTPVNPLVHVAKGCWDFKTFCQLMGFPLNY